MKKVCKDWGDVFMMSCKDQDKSNKKLFIGYTYMGLVCNLIESMYQEMKDEELSFEWNGLNVNLDVAGISVFHNSILQQIAQSVSEHFNCTIDSVHRIGRNVASADLRWFMDLDETQWEKTKNDLNIVLRFSPTKRRVMIELYEIQTHAAICYKWEMKKMESVFEARGNKCW